MENKLDFCVMDLERIDRDLCQELEKEEGPDWDRIENNAKALDILVKVYEKEES